MTAPQPQGWVQDGERWGLWRNGREIAAVQTDARGVRVVLACRKLWQDKEVRAATVAQGKRYAVRWCAARVLEGVPMKEAVAKLVAREDSAPKVSRTEIQQQRRLDAILNPKL